jgi:N-acyl-D-aspartate/D-glutamate deacylase
MGFDKMYERMFLLSDPPNYEPSREDSVASQARRQGCSGPEVAYDMMLSDEGRNFLYVAFTSFDGYTLASVEETLKHPNAMVGLGDAGAHVGFITDASFTTWLLTHWGRDRPHGRLPLEELVRRYTSDPAATVGLLDRGLLRVGMKADLNVIDFARLAVQMPYPVDDLPAGGRRLMQKARGYVATICSGVPTYREGEPTGRKPGQLVRAPVGPA